MSRQNWIMGAAGFLLALLFLASLGCGRYGLSIPEVARTLACPLTGDPGVTGVMKSVVLNVRLPRVLLAVAAGAGLAVAGAAFQALFSNPLATPDTLGVASGSAFGAVLGILLGLGGVAIQVISFFSGLAAVALVWAVSRVRGRSSILMLILSGLIVGAMFSALISLVKYLADPQDVLPSITYWIMGTFTGANMQTLMLGLPFIAAGSALIWLLRWRLNALSLPDDEVRSLGIPAGRLRALVIVSGTMITASVVSMCGLIGWVGLLIPHFARLLLGNSNERVVPASLLFGALFVLAADTAARSAAEIEFPVSILTALIGAPVFIALLRRTGSSLG
ncbi:iron ABC transporter permease [Mesosutterella sp. AGMB02718]|uniref:Iron ABC transporter permease n=1 Tax=Mesosutterella faecium TaxID=2925194 RepID=A0ABT7IPC8_9BURK|nr:iron ABC transporter permease [Mesosutterella sp. AGMB02718]MDL2060232.1 iron ABC transporter permease [Mesosutterella sp. AGMB02718]